MLPIMAESQLATSQRQDMIRMALEDRAPQTFLAMKKAVASLITARVKPKH